MDRARGVRLTAPELKAVLNALGERDETAEICRDRNGKPEPDPDLRDTETVPLKESIEEYFQREVLPHVPDAWIDHTKTKVGYEIPLNRHFYRYEPPRPLEEIEADIKSPGRRNPGAARGGDGVRLPPYPRYKPSGVEWLGDVPEHWDVRRSDGMIATEKRHVPPQEFAGKEVFHYSIPAIQELGTGMVEDGDSVESAKQAVTLPVVLVSRLNPRKATICRAQPAQQLTIASTEFVALQARRCNLRFLEYLVSSELFRQRLDSWVQSVTCSHQRAAPEHIYRFWAGWPGDGEQRAIAAFLDRETAQLDTLVAKKRALIELLKEKRSALISRTVTRGLPSGAARAAGLDPHPRLKPSGVEWIGDVPEHWDIKKGRFLGTLFGSVSPSEDDYTDDDGGTPFAKVDDLNSVDSSLWLSTTTSRVIGAAARRRTTILFPKRGAAIFTNKVAITDGACLFDPNLMGWEIRPPHETKFVAYCLIARRLDDLADVSTVPQINNKHIYPAPFPSPPQPEQRAIAAFLGRETAKLDQMAAKVEAAAERLQEYRAALITAAVTGKIDVRGAVA